MTNRLHTL